MPNNRKTSANDFQVGGRHYAENDVQAWDAITAWGLGFLDGNVVKYMSRWRKKGGLQDLLKAQHYLAKVIEEVEETQSRRQAAATINPEGVAEKFSPTLPTRVNRPPLVTPPPVRMKDEQTGADELKAAIDDLTKDMEVNNPDHTARAKTQ